MSNKFCPHCGAQLTDEGAQFCPACGNSITDTNSSTSEFNENSASQLPMNWYKFLIYFSLFAGAVINLIGGIAAITGIMYEVQTGGQATADMIYMYYGSSLKVADVLYGIALVGLAAINIITRMKLAKYKADGPKFLYISYGVGMAISLIYIVAVTAITRVSLIDASTVTQIIAMVVMLIINYKYFTRRSHLFIN